MRARNADPMCSFGDFAAISHIVDVATAKVSSTLLRNLVDIHRQNRNVDDYLF